MCPMLPEDVPELPEDVNLMNLNYQMCLKSLM
jgi:hypothetical protein